MPASDTVTFDYNTGLYRWTALAVAGAGVAAGLFSGIASSTAGALVAAFFFIIAAITFAQSFRRGPMLVIGPEGLTYAPFSRKPAPWSDLSAVTLVRYEGKRVDFPGKVVFYRQPNGDTVNFAVRDPKRYPSGPGRSFNRFMMKMQGLPPIAIQVFYVKGATQEAIAEAIGRHWSGKIEKKFNSYPRTTSP